MSRQADPPLISRRKASVPGKIFLMGEYAVLLGEPGLVATLSPRFVGSLDPVPGAEAPHSGSPAGRWKGSTFFVSDPYRGTGGFGASTAQFAFAVAFSSGSRDLTPFEIWQKYRTLTASEPLPPSGADLIAQLVGGVALTDPEKPESLYSQIDWSKFMVFSATGQAGRKVTTHDHLSLLGGESRFPEFRRELLPVLRAGVSALRAKDGGTWIETLREYPRVLSALGLELPAAREDREVLEKIPGVLAVKGCGALLADAVLVVAEPNAHEGVRKIAQSRGLKHLSTGLSQEPGFRWEDA